MARFFNSSGPVFPADHYHIDPLTRIDWEEVRHLIDAKRYFVLHAPRQTGKTSTLLAMMERLNQGEYRAVYANIEGAQAARHHVERGIAAVCSCIVSSITLYLHDKSPEEWLRNGEGDKVGADDRLRKLLVYWASADDSRPAVLMLDEVDALVGDTLISLLRQIRAGYAQRPQAFPQSIVLCGVRDVRDYRIHTSGQEIITGGSAFNIKAESMRMGNFNEGEVRALYAQHTEETGQIFAEEIYPELWQDTCGQPWLVNALGYELTWKNRAARERSRPITLQDYFAARENLIQSRATHLDQLADKLREPRVHRVIAGLLASEDQIGMNVPMDDLLYVEDLGLIRRRPQITITNRIYREIIPRELTYTTQYTISHEQEWYLTPARKLDMPKLLTAFQQFFRENADAWIERFDYKEAGPQLLMQAFLQRIINGGGRIYREYALGRKRTDLSIEWPVDEKKGYDGEVQRIILELKILRGDLAKTIAEGVKQTSDYAQNWGAGEAHLIIFNRDSKTPWDEKIWQGSETVAGKPIGTWGV